MNVDLLFEGLTILASLGFLFAVYFAIKLSKETKNERYWAVLAASAIILALHYWAMIPWGLHIINSTTQLYIEGLSGIIGAMLLGYALYGLYTSMKKVREKME
jgi:phosphotransferase system  glucose/maltose/N-acetylglucosamine-specific IIC component